MTIKEYYWLLKGLLLNICAILLQTSGWCFSSIDKKRTSFTSFFSPISFVVGKRINTSQNSMTFIQYYKTVKKHLIKIFSHEKKICIYRSWYSFPQTCDWIYILLFGILISLLPKELRTCTQRKNFLGSNT